MQWQIITPKQTLNEETRMQQLHISSFIYLFRPWKWREDPPKSRLKITFQTILLIGICSSDYPGLPLHQISIVNLVLRLFLLIYTMLGQPFVLLEQPIIKSLDRIYQHKTIPPLTKTIQNKRKGMLVRQSELLDDSGLVL